MALLETRKLSKDFGGLLAIANLNFHVDENEIVSVIGPNGAGKTTFFNLITGMYPALSGEIVFDGHNLAGLKPDKITHLGIARTFQTVRLFNNMTILENAMVAQHTRSKSGVVSAILHERMLLFIKAVTRHQHPKIFYSFYASGVLRLGTYLSLFLRGRF